MNDLLKVLQTPTFKKHIKKLHKNQKSDVDRAIREIMMDLSIGEAKTGDLSGVQVYKFHMVNQLTLLAYEVSEKDSTLALLSLGVHENFYRGLKQR